MREARINDVVLKYRIVGEGPPILFVHGLGSDMRGWEFQEKSLSKHFKVILIDQRGHGHSTGPGMDMISAEVFAADLNAFLEHLEIERVSVIGASMGGLISQQFALDYPERIHKLVLIDTGPKITEETIDEVYGWREAQVEGGDEAYFWEATRSCYPEEFIQQNKDTIDYLMSRENLLNPEGVLAAGLGLSLFNVEERLHEIKAPTLIIHGAEDKVFDVALAQLASSRIPNAKLVLLPGCGHDPGVQMTNELNQLLIEFLCK
ncbi:MAG: alpha/beta fold hydrolase [Candidatus Thorarchaeota archaeon]